MSILKSRLQDWADTKNILPTEQLAFRQKMGCIDHILTLNSIIHYSRSLKSQQVFTLFSDLSKAFDSVSHNKLFTKLQAMGAPTYLVNNIKSFYSTLTLQVKTTDGLSQSVKISKGVLQGEPISPLLFILYLVDLPTELNPDLGYDAIGMKKHILIFADDIVLLSPSAKYLNLQIKRLARYFSLHDLSLNTGKSKIVIFGRQTKAFTNLLEHNATRNRTLLEIFELSLP